MSEAEHNNELRSDAVRDNEPLLRKHLFCKTNSAMNTENTFLQNKFSAEHRRSFYRGKSREDFAVTRRLPRTHGINFGARVMMRALPFSRTAMSSMRTPPQPVR